MAQLTEEQQREAVLITSVGCDRETVAKYVGCTSAGLVEAMIGDAAFAASMLRAEASSELAHMRNVQQAGKDDKQWRASVWWLERRAPERYAKREIDAIGRRELVRLLGIVAAGIADVVTDVNDRKRVLERLQDLAESMANPLRPKSLESNTDAAGEERNQLGGEGE